MPKYVLRFTDDGLYNQGDGFPVPLSQATIYTSRAVAETRQHNLFDCEIVEIPDGAESPKPYTWAEWNSEEGALKKLVAPREVLERLDATVLLLDFYLKNATPSKDEE